MNVSRKRPAELHEPSLCANCETVINTISHNKIDQLIAGEIGSNVLE